jgi:rhamnulokinase
MEELGIPSQIFPPIVQPGTRLGVYEGIPVITPACHDTDSSVAAVPTQTPHYAYISSGTWSLVGLEVPEPIMTALDANVTNEDVVAGTYRLLRNVMGLWIIQQCRAAWEDDERHKAEQRRVRQPCSAHRQHLIVSFCVLSKAIIMFHYLQCCHMRV